jgi:hydroxyacylglutathione hydrolase
VLVSGFPAGPLGTNCFVVAPAAGEQCVVIDPGPDATGPLGQVLADHQLHPVAVLLTHGHVDHTFCVLPVCEARDIPAFIHPADRQQLTDPWSALGAFPGTPLFGALTFAEPADVRELADGAVLDLAGLQLAVRHAPGHTPGSVAFVADTADAPVFFSGDLLFAGSIGRVDLPGGSEEQMVESLARVVLPLDDETVVLPGHGPSTTIGRERVSNPYLQMVASGPPRRSRLL